MEDRNQPHELDQFYNFPSRPRLIVRRGQAKYKTKDHGAAAGIDYTIKTNGTTSTLRTEENIDQFIDVIVYILADSDSE